MFGKKAPALPKSKTHMFINLFGLLYALLAVYILCRHQMARDVDLMFATVISMAALIIPIVGLEAIFLRNFKQESTGLDFRNKKSFNLKRSAIKLLGFYATLAAVGIAYWLFPEYHGKFYNNYWAMLRVFLPWVLVLAMPYIVVVDRFMKDPEDGYWQAGMAILGKYSLVDKKQLGQHALGWVVKGFYLPLMFIYLTHKMKYFRGAEYDMIFFSMGNFYDFAWEASTLVDLLFASAGYIMTFRIFDTHIRSTEPTMLGWCVTLMVYQPFWSLYQKKFLNYHGTIRWDDWLMGSPTFLTAWTIALVFLFSVYAMATMVFGLRFSNLTNRGILTNGPFRFCKHPAYLSKNLSWWLASVPFISEAGVLDAVRHSALLGGVSFIYYMRAVTEERHLSQDPAYVEYALAMNQRSVMAWVGKLIPFFQYRPPARPAPARTPDSLIAGVEAT